MPLLEESHQMCGQARQIEEKYRKTDLVAESTIGPVVINLAESDS